MKETILALLLAKFTGVRKDGLAQLAAAMSLQAETNEEATALVEKMTPEKVDNFIKDWRRDVDREVLDGNKTFESNLKKKFDLVEKKKDPEPGNPDPKKPADPNDIAAIVAAAVTKAVEPIQQKLSAFEGQKTTETRLQQLQSRFADKDLPESYTSQKVKDFKRMSFESDEAFTEYLTELESDVNTFAQDLADKNMAIKPPVTGGRDQNGVSSAVSSYIASKSDPAKTLGGKEV